MENIGSKNFKASVISSSQTPFFRHLRKHTGRLVYGLRKSHWYQWNPGLELDRPVESKPGELRYRNRRIAEVQPLANLAALVSGKTVCIVGSGPSIAELDLDSLLNEVSFILNGAIYLRENHPFVPTIFCVEDERFIWTNFKKIDTMLPVDTACVFTPAVMRAICEISPEWFAKRPLYMIESVKKPYLESQLTENDLHQIDWLITTDNKKVGFSLNPSAGIFPIGTVAYSAFQIGVSLTPSTIGFAGIDLRVNPEKPRFYDTSKGSAWSGLNRSRAKILEGFKIGNKIATQQGINLENYSRRSALNEYGFTYSSRFERLTNGR